MTRYPTPPTPTNPWAGRLHLALTLILFVAAVSIAGLAVAGRVKFGEAAKAVAPEEEAKSKTEGGRYQIEKVDDVHEILDRAGLSFFHTEMYDTWVFRYRGGLIETTLEADLAGQTHKVAAVPENWKLALPLQTLKKGSEAPVDFTGYIILSAVRPNVTVVEALEPYYAHLGAILAFGPSGPLDVLSALFMEVRQYRPYRIFVSASPPPTSDGQGFNILDHDRPILISTPLVIKNPALEEAVFGGGKRLQPGKEEIILDRQRGYSRLRIKARFLTDGEARDLVPK